MQRYLTEYAFIPTPATNAWPFTDLGDGKMVDNR
jgi:hypothetical protein